MNATPEQQEPSRLFALYTGFGQIFLSMLIIGVVMFLGMLSVWVWLEVISPRQDLYQDPSPFLSLIMRCDLCSDVFSMAAVPGI